MNSASPCADSLTRSQPVSPHRTRQVCISFFGDGTCNIGQFYECLNMATLYKLPIIFFVENNLWAIGMSHLRATNPSMGDASPAIYKKGPPFGMPGVLVDGMDVLKVRYATVIIAVRLFM